MDDSCDRPLLIDESHNSDSCSIEILDEYFNSKACIQTAFKKNTIKPDVLKACIRTPLQKTNPDVVRTTGQTPLEETNLDVLETCTQTAFEKTNQETLLTYLLNKPIPHNMSDEKEKVQDGLKRHVNFQETQLFKQLVLRDPVVDSVGMIHSFGHHPKISKTVPQASSHSRWTKIPNANLLSKLEAESNSTSNNLKVVRKYIRRKVLTKQLQLSPILQSPTLEERSRIERNQGIRIIEQPISRGRGRKRNGHISINSNEPTIKKFMPIPVLTISTGLLIPTSIQPVEQLYSVPKCNWSSNTSNSCIQSPSLLRNQFFEKPTDTPSTTVHYKTKYIQPISRNIPTVVEDQQHCCQSQPSASNASKAKSIIRLHYPRTTQSTFDTPANMGIQVNTDFREDSQMNSLPSKQDQVASASPTPANISQFIPLLHLPGHFTFENVRKHVRLSFETESMTKAKSSTLKPGVTNDFVRANEKSKQNSKSIILSEESSCTTHQCWPTSLTGKINDLDSPSVSSQLELKNKELFLFKMMVVNLQRRIRELSQENMALRLFSTSNCCNFPLNETKIV